MQEEWFKLCTKKFIDINVTPHLQIFVVIDKGYQRLYSFSSEFISVQNHKLIVINNVDRLKTNKELFCFPIKSMKLIKNNIDIFQ